MNFLKTLILTMLVTAVFGADREITVSGARLLEKSADVIGEKYGIQVNYEDSLPFMRRGLNRTAQVWTPPQALKLQLVDTKTAAHQGIQVLPVLQTAIADYNAKGGISESYEAVLSESQRVISIVPRSTQAQKLAGGMLSPLDQRISMPPGKTSADLFLTNICARLSKGGVPVKVGIYPLNLFLQTEVSVPEGSEVARVVLQNALDTLTRSDARIHVAIPKLEWRLLYGVEEKYYALSIKVAREEVPTPQGNTMKQDIQ